MDFPHTWRWSDGVLNPARAIVFDIDGVLANADERQHMIEGEERNWPAFFAACGQDVVIEETSRVLELLGEDVVVVLLTGRPLEIEDETVNWLVAHKLRWNLLIMRDRGTYDSSLVFKEESVRTLKAAGFDLRLAFEDDQRNRAMLQREGVPCMYVHSGYYASRDGLKDPVA